MVKIAELEKVTGRDYLELDKLTDANLDALIEEYKLSQNTNGKKLYLGFIAGNSRKLLGEGNALVKEVGDAYSVSSFSLE